MTTNSVLNFAVAMQERLDANAHKGGWHRCSLGYLRKRLADEMGELKRAMDAGESRERIRHEAADVANFALMIAETYTVPEGGR